MNAIEKISLLAVLALMLFSCNKEDEVTGRPNYGTRSIFYASAEATSIPESKVYADENLMVLWNENDSISIFNMRTVNDLYVFTGEDGDTGGGFEEIPYSGFVTGNNLDHVYAVYPYSKLGNKINNLGTQITVTLPSEQKYKEHSFGIGSNTMVAVTDDNFLGFKNVCGYLKFRFYGDNVKVKSVTLEGNNGEKISGKAYITPSISSAPIIAMDDAATTSITLNCKDPVTLGPSSTDYTEFLFVVPPTTFENGFKITVTDELGGVFEKSSTRSLTISRNKMESMGAMKVEIAYDEENTFVPFEDANFKAYCVNNFDTNNDGEISLAEAKNVTSISVYTDENCDNISSLKGIEFFVNLSNLDCRGSGASGKYLGKLTSLDVSHNTALNHLTCSYNQLTSLDVSQNTVLTGLDCHYNQLTSLVVSQNPRLDSLNCSNNQISQLDICNNSYLTYLRCGGNQLTQLDLSNNTELTWLACGANQLSQLEVSHNTKLTYLACGANQLSQLEVSHNTKLTYLACDDNQLTSLDISHNPNLISLFCSSCSLSSLDLSHNPNLLYFYCNNNQLTSLDLSNNADLQRLICSSNKLVSLVVSNLSLTFLEVSDNKDLQYLDCHSNQLSSLLVSGNTALYYLDCHFNQLKSLNIDENSTLTTLNCHSNQLSSLEISGNPDLTDLTAWPQNVTLATLYISAVQNLQYKNSSGDVINPTDYSTEIIVRPTLQYEDYKSISYDTFWYVDTAAMAFTSRPGSIDENLDATTAKLQKARNTDNYYKLVLYGGAASIEFKNNGDSTITIDKYPGYNDPITIHSGQISFTSTVNGHTYYFELRPAKCSVYPSTSPLIHSGDFIELEGWIKKDESFLSNGYNTYQSFLVE